MSFINHTTIEQALDKLQNNEAFQAIVQNIKAGKFERNRDEKDYKDRIVYTQELRNYLYNPAILNVIFGTTELKEKFFRTFGYKGQLEFTIYPHCWLRDLPLLDIGKNVYLADNILLGTNQVTPDQKYLVVGKIKIGDNCIFDQGCSVGAKSTIGKDGIIGFEVAIGFKNRIGSNVKLGGRTTISHGCRIGNDVSIGDISKIGSFTIIEDGVTLEEMTEIPSYSLVTKEGIFDRRTSAKKPEAIKRNINRPVSRTSPLRKIV